MSQLSRLLLVRHGETSWTHEHRLQGQTDIPLDDAGRAQAAALRPIVQEFMPNRVVSSPALRAAETAELLSDLTPVFEPRLKEADLGEWEGLTPAEIGEDYAGWRAGTVVPPGGEPREVLIRRVTQALQEAVESPGTVLVATHGGVVRAVLDALLGLRTDQIVPVAPASLTVLDTVTGQLDSAKLRHYNLTPALREPHRA